MSFPPKTELHATSIKLGLIGSSESGALPELVELVSAHAKCINTNLM